MLSTGKSLIDVISDEDNSDSDDNDDDDDGDDDDGGDGDDEHDDIPQAVSWPSPGAGIAAQAMWSNAIKFI